MTYLSLLKCLVSDFRSPISSLLMTRLDEIENARLRVLDCCFGVLQAFLDSYATKSLCKSRGSSCDAMVLGGLIRGLVDRGLHPLPAGPYESVSYASLSDLLQSMALPSLCERLQEMRFGKRPDKKACGLKETLNSVIRQAGSARTGLDLCKF
jgi:hypothetical protein